MSESDGKPDTKHMHSRPLENAACCNSGHRADDEHKDNGREDPPSGPFDNKTPLTQQILHRIYNHPVLAVLVIGGMSIIAVAAVLSAFQQIRSTYVAAITRHDPEDDLRKRAIQVIADTSQVRAGAIHLLTYKWCDLLASGTNADLCTSYEISGERCVSIFSTRPPAVQRLFHESNNVTDFDIARYGNRSMVVCWKQEGSGGYLSLGLYEWDGVGPLKEAFALRDGLFCGSLWIVDGRVFISEAGRRLEIVQDQSFRLVPYTKRPCYPELGESFHVVTLGVENDNMVIAFDNNRVEFNKEHEMSFRSKNEYVVCVGDSIMLDDNIGIARQIRFFTNDDVLSWKEGLYSAVVPNRAAKSSVTINDEYGPWYKIDIKIVDSISSRLD